MNVESKHCCLYTIKNEWYEKQEISSDLDSWNGKHYYISAAHITKSPKSIGGWKQSF